MRADVAGARRVFTAKGQPVNGWVEICAGSFLRKEDVLRFDHEGKTYAVYRGGDGNLYASDGVCSHGNAHLADGLVSGTLIECGKHHGRFDITDGSPRRQPACVAIRTYQAREHEGKIFLDLASAGGAGLAQRAATYRFRVVSNDNVATFIKELVLEPGPGSPLPAYRPGDYLQFDIPAYDEISFSEIAVSAPFVDIWKAQRVFDFHAENLLPVRRNFSMAGNPGMDEQLRFNVRISTPPRGRDCSAGVGSTYLHRLKPGDTITAIGPFGTFHIKPTEKEMVYLGGGAGMAAGPAWPPSARTSPISSRPKRPAAASASGTAPARCGRAFTGIISRTWPGDSPTSLSTSRSPSLCPGTTGNRTPA
jgi:MocE subfamily Rieske [2Fe-2S] domain protein